MDVDPNNAQNEDDATCTSSVAGSPSTEESEIVANTLSAEHLNFNRNFKPGQQRHLLDLPPGKTLQL